LDCVGRLSTPRLCPSTTLFRSRGLVHRRRSTARPGVIALHVRGYRRLGAGALRGDRAGHGGAARPPAARGSAPGPRRRDDPPRALDRRRHPAAARRAGCRARCPDRSRCTMTDTMSQTSNTTATAPCADVRAARRRSVIEAMRAAGGGVAILPTAPERMRNRDSDYPYRWDSYFHYLTGFPEPEAVL